MLKTIIGKLERKKKQKQQQQQQQHWSRFFFFPLKLKRLTQNLKAELKRFWVGLDSGTK